MKKEQSNKNSIPRRAQINKFAPTEMAIFKSIQEIEKLPADIRLTDAIILLQRAKDKVSDYIDSTLIK
jgi:hypothetical protein